jgi:hypothetical protein
MGSAESREAGARVCVLSDDEPKDRKTTLRGLIHPFTNKVAPAKAKTVIDWGSLFN